MPYKRRPAGERFGAQQQRREMLGETLKAGGFLVDVHPGRTALRDLFAPLRRSRLTRNEARLWRNCSPCPV